MFTNEARRLTFSRLMRKPLAAMQNRVNELLGTDFEESRMRYAVYSAHDDQISNMMEWLHPNNVAMDYVLYASQVVFELKYDDQCLAEAEASEACFSVAVIWNGHDLGFDECAGSAQDDGTGCSYADFKNQMDNIWYSGYSADDLDEACNYVLPESHKLNYVQ